ncbi:hypothetical protein BYI23_A011340 [Burkholderia sp. YI23]|nr:hypothetical protein BYI23_A011340 [Burkholderia sp. YI23]
MHEFAALKRARGESGFGSDMLASGLDSVRDFASGSRGAISGGGSGFDWLGATEAGAGAVPGGAGSDDESGGDSMLKSFEGADDSDGGSLLSNAEPFEYVPSDLSGDAEQLAASTNNPRFAAKMLGYDYKRFGDILHDFKPDNGLGPADNVIWHDNGDVYFNGNFVANFHDWAN